MIRDLILAGDGAFYNSPGYEETTKYELSHTGVLPEEVFSYGHSEDPIDQRWSVLGGIVQSLGSKFLMPSTWPWSVGESAGSLKESRLSLAESMERNHWKVKRIPIGVRKGERTVAKIDAMIIVGNHPENRRWFLMANGNGEYYENVHYRASFRHILSGIKGNALIFNYPRAGDSEGEAVDKEILALTYSVVLRYLETLNPKEIVMYGYSIGGGIMGEGLKGYVLKPNVKYVAILDRTFPDYQLAVSEFTGMQSLGRIAGALGFNLRPIDSVRHWTIPVIVLQSAAVTSYKDISDQPTLIRGDGILTPVSSMATALLANKVGKNFLFLGIPEPHAKDFYDKGEFLVSIINKIF